MKTIIRRAVKPETIYDKVATIVVVGIGAVAIGWNMAAFFSRYTIGEFAVVLVGTHVIAFALGVLVTKALDKTNKNIDTSL